MFRQLVKHKSTGEVGVIGVDPFGIRGSGEIIVSFFHHKDPDPLLGSAYPRDEFEKVQPEEVSPHYRKRYGVKTKEEQEREIQERRIKAEKTMAMMEAFAL